MGAFEVARDLYRDGKLVLDATRDRAASDDVLRWLREDLEEDLLDIKLSVVEGSEFDLPELMTDAVATMVAIFSHVRPPKPDEGDS